MMTKIKAIVELQPPNSKRQVHQILVFLGYYQQYLKNYQKIAQPITDLLHKAQPDNVRAQATGSIRCVKVHFDDQTGANAASSLCWLHNTM